MEKIKIIIVYNWWIAKSFDIEAWVDFYKEKLNKIGIVLKGVFGEAY